jgi:hypothetical protein
MGMGYPDRATLSHMLNGIQISALRVTSFIIPSIIRIEQRVSCIL